MSLFRVPLFRSALLLAVAVTCAGALSGCGSGTKDAAGDAKPSTPAAPSSRPASPSPTPDDCPTRAQIADVLSTEGDLKGVAVSPNVVCDSGWATASIHPLGTDPARAVVRREGGKVRLVTYGTDGLCDAPAMKRAPAKIKKALGGYCRSE